MGPLVIFLFGGPVIFCSLDRKLGVVRLKPLKVLIHD